MSYSGNPSLSADVKERILGTFQQTLDLAREGSRQEALLGFDFVLRLDRVLAGAGGGAPPPSPPRAAAPGPSLDLSRASADPLAGLFGGREPESDRRVRELLDEGQAAFDAGDPQGAIDSWSRIFLIDIDHQEAARRIDSARRVKAETERQGEEIFH